MTAENPLGRPYNREFTREERYQWMKDRGYEISEEEANRLMDEGAGAVFDHSDDEFLVFLILPYRNLAL